jgi:Undecaprenyl-phosphate glucose phosphotransferase
MLVFGTAGQSTSKIVVGYSRFALTHSSFAAMAFAAEFALTVAIAIATGVAYHSLFYAVYGPIESFAAVGSLVGLAYGLAFLARDDYGIESALEGRRSPSLLFLVWNLAFVAIAVVGFLTKSTHIYSRGWLTLFYVSGFAVMILTNAGLNRAVRRFVARGWVRRRRLMIVGTDAKLGSLEREIADAARFFTVARVAIPHDVRSPSEIEGALEAAVANARALSVDDILISDSLSSPDFLERSVRAFSVLPSAIHLSAGGLFGRFKDARVARFGHAAALSLTRAPLGRFEAMAKRWLDVLVSAAALVLLSPLFAVIAILIKCDSRGPVFFRQRRRGYNTAEFQIWKFRTMTTLDDGDTVRQASKNDARVTGVGRLLRRTSLDELPQLLNVLRGEMSLVGPRPHAVAHDRFFERRIADYPRRLNVKPGITGWAQVNGFRGETGTDEAMRARVDHDLYYIDNCSFAFDLYILLLTVMSPKASRNAY